MSDHDQTAELSSPDADVAEASRPYIGRWNRLVSTTNWEKGKIICQWRTALQAAGAPPSEYSDDAWSQQVGYVSPQHVGRLRRVHERFGTAWNDYEGLYWSHFHAALDWNDAEMWLEGAVQNAWSVSRMRTQRWETVGAPGELKPADEDIVASEMDEDVAPALDNDALDSDEPGIVSALLDFVSDPGSDEAFEPDFGDEQTTAETAAPVPEAASPDDEAVVAAAQRVRPFAGLAELPADLSEAFEGFKLAILRHKLDGWKEVARDDVLGTLDALKELALAP